jgi:hypothetical protein
MEEKLVLLLLETTVALPNEAPAEYAVSFAGCCVRVEEVLLSTRYLSALVVPLLAAVKEPEIDEVVDVKFKAVGWLLGEVQDGVVQIFVGELEFRGFGVSAVKSAELLSVSVQPLLFLIAAVVLLNVGAAPVPSKQLAPLVPVPTPTKSIIEALASGHTTVKAVELLTRAILNIVADIAMVPVASGVGKFAVPPVPAAC